MQSVRFDDSAYQSAIDIVALDTDYGRNHFEVFTFDLPPGPPRWQLSAIMALDPRLGRDALHRCRLFRRGFGCGAYRGEQGGQATLDSLSQAIPTFHLPPPPFSRSLALALSISKHILSHSLALSLCSPLVFSLGRPTGSNFRPALPSCLVPASSSQFKNAQMAPTNDITFTFCPLLVCSLSPNSSKLVTFRFAGLARPARFSFTTTLLFFFAVTQIS